MNKRTVLIWFRNDLRIQDNEMLSRASERGEAIIPVYCFDPRNYTQTKFNTWKTGVLRAQFIQDSVKHLQDYFRSKHGDLIIKVGFPEQIIPALVAQYHVDEVYHHREVAEEETAISSLVEDALWRIKVNLRHFIGHTLFHKEDFPFPIRDIPNSFPVFRKKLERESFIRSSFPKQDGFLFHGSLEVTSLPSLVDLGFDPPSNQTDLSSRIVGGEEEATKQLALCLEKGVSSQGVSLSPWLALGCLSVHTVYFLVKDSALPKKMKEHILQGLWWKDYYRFMFKKYGNVFFQEKGFTGNAPMVNDSQAEGLDRWKNGETLNASVNDIMLRLKKHGYIDFRSREEVGTYLIHHLHVSWLWGAAYFEEMLVDYNPASNYGNWAHLAGVGSSLLHNYRISGS